MPEPTRQRLQQAGLTEAQVSDLLLEALLAITSASYSNFLLARQTMEVLELLPTN